MSPVALPIESLRVIESRSELLTNFLPFSKRAMRLA